MASAPDDEFSFPLLENGLDFLASAVELLGHQPARLLEPELPSALVPRAGPGAREFKYALLHLAAGIELLLKERLRREEPAQVLKQPKTFDQGKYDRGDFISVALMPAAERLSGFGVAIAERDLMTLELLVKKRNRAQHFSITDRPVAVLAVTSASLGFALNFVAEHLERAGISADAGNLLTDVRERLGALKAFVAARWVEIQPEVDAAPGAVVACPACGEEAAVLDDGAHCAFCRYEASAEAGAEDYAYSTLGVTLHDVMHDGDDWPVGTCPDCESETLVDMGPSGSMHPGMRWVCFRCARSWDEGELEQCGRCGTWIPAGRGELSVCMNCFDWVVNASD